MIILPATTMHWKPTTAFALWWLSVASVLPSGSAQASPPPASWWCRTNDTVAFCYTREYTVSISTYTSNQLCLIVKPQSFVYSTSTFPGFGACNTTTVTCRCKSYTINLFKLGVAPACQYAALDYTITGSSAPPRPIFRNAVQRLLEMNNINTTFGRGGEICLRLNTSAATRGCSLPSWTNGPYSDPQPLSTYVKGFGSNYPRCLSDPRVATGPPCQTMDLTPRLGVTNWYYGGWGTWRYAGPLTSDRLGIPAQPPLAVALAETSDPYSTIVYPASAPLVFGLGSSFYMEVAITSNQSIAVPDTFSRLITPNRQTRVDIYQGPGLEWYQNVFSIFTAQGTGYLGTLLDSFYMQSKTVRSLPLVFFNGSASLAKYVGKEVYPVIRLVSTSPSTIMAMRRVAITCPGRNGTVNNPSLAMPAGRRLQQGSSGRKGGGHTVRRPPTSATYAAPLAAVQQPKDRRLALASTTPPEPQLITSFTV